MKEYEGIEDIGTDDGKVSIKNVKKRERMEKKKPFININMPLPAVVRCCDFFEICDFFEVLVDDIKGQIYIRRNKYLKIMIREKCKKTKKNERMKKKKLTKKCYKCIKYERKYYFNDKNYK
ncbi:MAG: hypothetical protein QXU98_13070 [Candidatus Parvarchaeota archaeon]